MKVKKSLIYIFYILFFLLTVPVIVISFTKPSNNLLPAQITVFSLLAFAIIFGMALIWKKLYSKITKIEPVVYYAFLVVFGVVLFLLLKPQVQTATKSLYDYTMVFNAASELASGKLSSDYYNAYYIHYDNNISPMILLSWIFNVADFLHITRYSFTLAIVCCQVVVTARSMGYLLEDKTDKTWRLPAAIALSVFLPVWGFSAAFYTDTMSMGLAIIVLALIKRAIEENDKKKRQSICGIAQIVEASILIVLTIEWKITGLIPIIGIVMAYWLIKKDMNFRVIIVLSISFICSFFVMAAIINSYPIKKNAKDTADPILSWVALGLDENGTWEENRKLTDTLHSFTDKEKKERYVNEYIKENWTKGFSPTHLYRKALYNFSDGNLSAKDFSTLSGFGTFVGNLFNPWGKYYWRVSQINTNFLFSMYLFILSGGVLNFIKMFKKKEISVVSLGSHLSFVGIVVFLMIWEANSRQLYNQIPMLIVGEICFLKEGATLIECVIGKKKKENKQ